MRTFQTSTQIAPIVSVGTYWGWFEYERLWGQEEESDREEGFFVCQDYSRSKLGEALITEANEVFAHEKLFEDVGVIAVRAVSFSSPREYNFSDDWLDLEFDVADDFLDRAEKRVFDPLYEKRFKEYIKDHWCSRDGFISYMPAECLGDMHEVFRQLREDDCGLDDMRCFGSVIALLYEAARQDGDLVDDEDIAFDASMTGQLLEKFKENHSLGEFCTIMDLDEAEEKYPGVKELLALPDRKRAELAEILRKYLESDVSEAGKKRVQEKVYIHGKWLNKFSNDVREAVERNHPNENVVKGELAELRQRWTDRFEDAGNVKARDLPGQLVLEGL